jgi:site-specific DNA recombinase
MIVVREDVLGCSAQRNKGTCNNRRTISLREIEERVVLTLRRHLLAPDIVAAAVEAYRFERDRLMKRRTTAAREAAREAAAIDAKIARIVRAIEDGDGDWRPLMQRLKGLEAERAEILSRVPEPLPDSALALHPRAAERYRQKVDDIHAALRKGDEAGQEAVAALRELITRIVATPAEGADLIGLTIEGDLAAILERGTNDAATSMVAGAGFEPATFRL